MTMDPTAEQPIANGSEPLAVGASRPSVTAIAGIAVRGFAMGSADVIPGVSGGTVALVTGIYPRLVAAISAGSSGLGRFVKGDIRGGMAALTRVDWWFLSSLVFGAAAAVLTLAGVIEDLLNAHPIRMAGLFLGMIVGTIVVAWRLVNNPSRRHALVALLIGGLAFLSFGLQSSLVTDPGFLVVFLAGGIAICAFILPGVSGSFLLLSIGMYQAILGAVSDRDLAIVAVFGIGAIVGLALFSQFLETMLNRHHDTVVAGLIGLMLGSFRILWPWPNGLGDADGIGATVLGAPSGEILAPTVLAIFGALAVMAFSSWGQRRSR